MIDVLIALFPSERTSLRIKQIPLHVCLDKNLESWDDDMAAYESVMMTKDCQLLGLLYTVQTQQMSYNN